MLAKRIIPCLDIRDGRTVKGVNFTDLRSVGDPVELGARYAAEGADELVYLDISATAEGRRTFTGLVSRIAARIDIPFTVGGGIASVDDAGRLLDAGADKITVNSAAVADPSLIDAVAAKYGSQFVTVAIDARRIDGRWRVTTHGGRRLTDRELFAWAEEACRRGAGEILFTSMDHDGTRNGYPCDTFAHLSFLPVPVIASGGAGSVQHIADVLTLGRADAALAAIHDAARPFVTPPCTQYSRKIITTRKKKPPIRKTSLFGARCAAHAADRRHRNRTTDDHAEKHKRETP